ncbi:RNA-binding S4 domain-containing protein [soil metagenome]
MTEPPQAIRLDKWLWHARLFRTRALAARAVAAGRIRVNAVRILKPATQVRIGDGLTFADANGVRVVEIRGIGARRGPAVEARALYRDRSPGAPDPAGA